MTARPYRPAPAHRAGREGLGQAGAARRSPRCGPPGTTGRNRPARTAGPGPTGSRSPGHRWWRTGRGSRRADLRAPAGRARRSSPQSANSARSVSFVPCVEDVGRGRALQPLMRMSSGAPGRKRESQRVIIELSRRNTEVEQDEVGSEIGDSRRAPPDRRDTQPGGSSIRADPGGSGRAAIASGSRSMPSTSRPAATKRRRVPAVAQGSVHHARPRRSASAAGSRPAALAHDSRSGRVGTGIDRRK